MTQIDEPNLDEQLSNLLTDYLLDCRPITKDIFTNGKKIMSAHEHARESIKALISDQVAKARIDEIKRMREGMTFAHMTPSIYAAERIKNILGELEL